MSVIVMVHFGWALLGYRLLEKLIDFGVFEVESNEIVGRIHAILLL